MGDNISWINELKWTCGEFIKAFENIGIIYKSEEEFDKRNGASMFHKKVLEGDDGTAFKPVMFCCYIDKRLEETWWFVNLPYIEKLLVEINSTSK
jgi:hypothetical protein